MSSNADLQRDKLVTKHIHRLFFTALLQRRSMLLFTYLGNMPGFFIINVLIPLQVAYGMQAILSQDVAHANHQAIVVLLLSAAGTLLFAAGTWANHRTNVGGGLYMQRQVFSNLLNKDYDFYSSRFIGSLGSDAISLRKSFQEFAYLMTIDIPRIGVIIIAGLGVIAYKSPLLGVASAFCVVLVISATTLMAKFRLTYRREVSEANSQLAGVIGDPLSQGPAVKSFAQEDYELERLKQPLDRWRLAQLKIYDSSIPQTILRHSLLGITMALLLVLSAKLYSEHEISIAIVVLVQLYVVRIVYSTVEVGEIIKRYEALMSDAHEPSATMLVPTLVNDANQTKQLDLKKDCTIALNTVSYQYPEAAKTVQAIQDFSLSIKKGEKIGLVGFSGGGKTTITKLLLRFMDVTQGSITINDVDIRAVSQAQLRHLIAYVPQEPLLFHRSIKENIAYAKPDASRAEILRAAKTAYVDDFVKELPQGYDSMVGERGVKLSGGQRQRIAIARALLKRSPILILDEATSALDSRSEQYIQTALWELMKNKTAIVIAHRLSTIQHMDRIAVIDGGKIVQLGSHADLLKDHSGAYARLWAHQSGGYITEQTTD